MPMYGFDPPTPEEQRQTRERKAQEWKENTAAGLVGITSDSETGEYSRADRFGYIDRWVGKDSWDRYVAALSALKAAEADLA